jgi:hypothetical protein
VRLSRAADRYREVDDPYVAGTTREDRTMATARDIMSGGADCARTSDTLTDAASDDQIGKLVEAISTAPANN